MARNTGRNAAAEPAETDDRWEDAAPNSDGWVKYEAGLVVQGVVIHRVVTQKGRYGYLIKLTKPSKAIPRDESEPHEMPAGAVVGCTATSRIAELANLKGAEVKIHFIKKVAMRNSDNEMWMVDLKRRPGAGKPFPKSAAATVAPVDDGDENAEIPF